MILSTVRPAVFFLRYKTRHYKGLIPEGQSNQTKVDESTSRNLQAVGTVQKKLVDVQSPPQRQVEPSQQSQQTRTPLPQEHQQTQVPAGDSSQSRTEDRERQEERMSHTGQPSTLTSTQRRIEDSKPEIPHEGGQQTEDPFRTLRSFHEKQRVERQGGDQPRVSVSSHSTLEGAVGVETQYPKPQRQTKKHQSQGNSRLSTGYV